MVSSCVRYSTLFFQHDDVTCKLSVFLLSPTFVPMKDEPPKEGL